MRVGPAFLQTFAVQVVQSIASVATGILIARGLGPAGQGQYAVLVAAVGLLSTLAAVGQFEGHVLSSAGEHSRGRIFLIRSAVQALAATALLGLGHGLWFSWLRLDGQGAWVGFFVLVLTCEILALLFRGINLGQHHITAYNVATLLQRVVYLVAAIYLSASHAVRVATVLVAWAIAVVLNVFLSGVWIWRRSGVAQLSWTAVAQGWSRSLTQGLRALLTVGLTLLLVRGDVYMLGPMLGPEAVGQISVASTLAEYLWYIPSILSSVLFAAVAARRDPDTLRKLCRASRTTVAILGPAALVLAIAGRALVPLLYGEAYTEAGTVFVLLLPGMFAISVHLVVDSYFTGSGFPPITYLAAAGAVVLKIGLNLIAVPRWGVEGAAVSTSVVYGSLLGAKLLALHRQTGVSYQELLRPTWSDVKNNIAVVRLWLSRFGQAVA
jgi:O-antigen/teichoic acid export membrane protein